MATTEVRSKNQIITEHLPGSTYKKLQDHLSFFHSAGWISGGGITDNLDETINAAAGYGFIRTDPDRKSTVYMFDWPAATNISIPDGTVRFIYVSYNSGNPAILSTDDEDTIDNQTEFMLATVINDGAELHITQEPHRVGDHATRMIERIHGSAFIRRDERLGGLMLSESADNNRYVSVTAGRLWHRLGSFNIDALNTSGTDRFDAYYRDGSNGWTKQANQQIWPNGYYDNNSGSLQPLTNNWYANLWFYVELDSDIVMLYGWDQYANQTLAVQEAPPSQVPLRLSEHGTLLGRIIFREGQTIAAAIQSAWIVSFPLGSVADHGELGGLLDDDHTQYFLADGSRQLNGNLTFTGARSIVTTANELTLAPATNVIVTTGKQLQLAGAVSYMIGAASATAFRLVNTIDNTFSLGANITTTTTGGSSEQSALLVDGARSVNAAGAWIGIKSAPTISASSGTHTGILYGVYSFPRKLGTSVIPSVIGVYGQVGNAATGELTTATALYANTVSITGGTIATQYGLYIADMTGASANYAIFAGTGESRFKDKIMIGTQAVAADGLLHIHTNTAGTVAPSTSYDELTIENNATAGMTILTPNNSVGGIAFGDPQNNVIGIINYSHTDDSMNFVTGGSTRLTLIGGITGINVTTNTSMTTGLTINQGTADDEIFALKSTGDVAHGITQRTETDTYFSIRKHDGDAGGALVIGLTEDIVGIQMQPCSTVEDTTKGNTGLGYFVVNARLKSGTGLTNPGTDSNLFVIRRNATTRFIVDQEGDVHYDGTLNVYDEYDDVALLRTAMKELTPGQIIQNQFDDLIESNRELLEKTGIVTFNPDGHHFVNQMKLQKLIAGSIWQLASKVYELENELKETKKLLEAGNGR